MKRNLPMETDQVALRLAADGTSARPRRGAAVPAARRAIGHLRLNAAVWVLMLLGGCSGPPPEERPPEINLPLEIHLDAPEVPKEIMGPFKPAAPEPAEPPKAEPD